jgi:hypothetical protein
MGITQLPPVPVPSAKGEIVVGTATGAVKITAPTTANQGILSDSTTASGLKFGITGLTVSHQLAPGHTNPTTITGYTYSSPNCTYSAAGHSFLVGHTVRTNGIVQNSTTASPGREATVTAVSGSSTFTFDVSTTAPGSYVSGGLATFSIGGNPSLAKYVNGVYFLGTTTGSYWYSTDAITWTYGQVPTYGNPIVAIDHDGTTYAILVSTPGSTGNGIYTSATLASNSWVNRNAFGTNFYIGDLKWCGGSVNRWVAVGSTNTAYNHSSGRIETAPSGATTWTQQTISGTNSGTFISVAFDGASTVMALGSHISVSTSGGGSWTSYATNVTTNPSSDIANQAYLQGISPRWGIWNPVTSRWIVTNIGRGLGRGMSTTGAVSAPWNRRVVQQWWCNNWTNVNSTSEGGNTRHPMIYDSVSQRFLTYSLEGGNFSVFSYSPTPIAINTFEEYYPLTGIQTSVNMPQLNFKSTNSDGNTQGGTFTACYGNGKWAVLSQIQNIGDTGSFIISTLS